MVHVPHLGIGAWCQDDDLVVTGQWSSLRWGTSDGTLGNVTTGNADTYLNASAATVAAYGLPVYIRLAFEFNGNWEPYGNGNETAPEFVAGWQYVVTKVCNAGGTNAKWIWSPNIWGTGGGIVDPVSGSWYPGDSYVDYVASTAI